MSRKKEKPANVKVPERHPVAWKSALWPHLDLIRSMRRGRKSFQEIADHLAADHSVFVTYRTVRNFLSRVSQRIKKGKGMPLGFEAHEPKPPIKRVPPIPKPPVLPAFPASEPDAFSTKVEQDNEDPFASYDPAKTKE